MTSVGLDLGINSFKVVELDGGHEKWALKRLGIALNTVGQLVVADPEQKRNLSVIIKKLFSETKISSPKARVSLPESQVYTRVLKMPVLSPSELSSAIRWEAEQYIPIPLDKVQLDYTVLTRPPKGVKSGSMSVLLVAAQRDVINYLIDIVSAADIEITSIETSTLALVRALINPNDSPTLIINLGASSSDFCIADGKEIALTYAIPTAGISFTRAITTALNLSPDQAEEYKRAYGLNKDLLEGKVRSVLLPVFQSITAEAKKVINAYESSHYGQKIQRIIVTGGTAFLQDITSEIANSLGVSEVMLGDPFTNISVAIPIPQEKTVYAVAVGLAKGGNL